MTCPHDMENIVEQTVHIQLERHSTSETWRQFYRKQIQSKITKLTKKDDPTFSGTDKEVELLLESLKFFQVNI